MVLKALFIFYCLNLSWDDLLLPPLDAVHLVDHHHYKQEEVVPHVDQAPNLRSHNPDDAEPPDSNVEEEAAEDVSNKAADDGSNHMMDGLFLFLIDVWCSRSPLDPEVSVLQILPGKLKEKSKGKANDQGDEPAHDEVEDDAMEDVHEAVGIKHVLGHFRSIPFRDPKGTGTSSPDQHDKAEE